MAATIDRPWTATEVRDLPEVRGLQFETIDGELFVTPAPSGAHQLTGAALLRRIANYLVRERVADVFMAPTDVEADERTLVQPDLSVFPRTPTHRARTDPETERMLLAVEILSPRSIRRDRIVKRRLYARMGAEYWLVDHEARTVERFLPDAVEPEVLTGKLDWLPPGASAPLSISLPELFSEALDP